MSMVEWSRKCRSLLLVLAYYHLYVISANGTLNYVKGETLAAPAVKIRAEPGPVLWAFIEEVRVYQISYRYFQK